MAMASLPPLIPIADRAGRERPPNNSSPTRPSRSRSSSPFFRVLFPKDEGGGVGTPPLPLIGRTASANTKGGVGAGWMPPRIGRNAAAITKEKMDTVDSVGPLCGTLGQCSDDRNYNPAAVVNKISLSIESYAVYHDEIVTALIEEALRKGGDETNVTDGQQAVETNTESRSPCKTKRNTPKQLGIGSPGIPKLLKRARSDLAGGVGDKKNLLTVNTSSRSLTMSSKMNSNDPSDFFHQDCILQKEMGSDTQKSKLGFGSTKAKSKNCGGDPSATGREETLLKLQQKLSMLRDIESGKYGMAAEMLRSDAVAFAIEAGSDYKKKAFMTKVETRSILTLRMGFVSMSYGILLQWDCGTGLVELIVLRKMCRDDFLKGKGNIDESVRDSNLISVSQRNSSLPRMPILPPKPALIPAPLADVSPTEVSLDSTSPPDFFHNGCGRRAPPKLSLPPNPLAGIPRFLSGALSSKSQHFLSVSVLRVTGLFAECDSCRDSTSVKRAIHRLPLRKYRTVRPFIRFSLGNHEYCTRVTMINNGNAKWYQRHRNSCLLPCPPEELSWFAGREDLIVEVLNGWENPGSSGKVGTSGKPILAAVKVPLSSVNIENEDDISNTGKDGASSTKITIPLRMNCCTNAPLGSISLKITMLAPSHGGGVNTYANPSARSKPNIQVVNESIELGLLTRYMDSWSLGGGAIETRDAPQTKSRKKRKRLRWSKRFDLETKRWSNLTPNSSMQKEEGSQGEGAFGWFTFLNNK